MEREVAQVRRQYEQFPYPPVPWLALPRGSAERLSLAYGLRAVGRTPPRDYRVLVAGCGTLEALVAARANRAASELVALDLSQSSLDRLTRRLYLHRVARPWSRLPRVRRVTADVLSWEPSAKFDFIVASNFLHHLPDPAAGLARLASWLAPGGMIRMVTYPKASRLLMRWSAAHFRTLGLSAETPNLFEHVREEIARLSPSHPVRECVEAHPEVKTRTGLVDAFFHALERPLSPLEWEAASARAGLRLVAEDQEKDHRSSALAELLPATSKLSAWQRLELMDLLLELNVNPVLWLEKGSASPSRLHAGVSTKKIPLAPLGGLPEAVASELRASLTSIEPLLAECGLSWDETSRTLDPRIGRFLA